MTLKLFHIDLDGCVTYWVAAFDADAAKQLIRDFDGCDDVDEPVEWTVEEADLAVVGQKMIRDDDHGRMPLSVCFAETTKPEIIACSEW